MTVPSSNSSGHPPGKDNAMRFPIPKAMEIEHEELHAELKRLTNSGGRTGEAAKAVAKLLHSHFVKENEYALPPLSLLVPLSQGKFESDMAGVLELTDRLEADLPAMLAEHREIVTVLDALTSAARAEDRSDGVQFADALTAHALTEEEITYPTALLVGRYVRSKLALRAA